MATVTCEIQWLVYLQYFKVSFEQPSLTMTKQDTLQQTQCFTSVRNI